MKRLLPFLCITLSAVATGTVQAGPHAYVLTEFKGLADVPYPGVNDLNNLGAAVGALDDQPTQAAYWSSPAKPRLLPSFSEDTYVWGLNDNGDACGAGLGARERQYALYWPGAGQMQILPDLYPRPDAGAGKCNRLNNAGVKIGTSQTPDRHTHAVTWDGSNAVHDLGALQGNGGDSEALGISPSGLIVGDSSVASTGDVTYSHAVLWQNGLISDLGTLGGFNSVASSINDAGEIVGESDIENGTNGSPPLAHAVLWRSGAPIDLGVLAGYTRSSAYGVNGSGAIVGTVFNDPQTTLKDSHAILWDQGEMVDLTMLLRPQVPSDIYLLAAIKINEDGQIVLYAFGQTDLTVHYYLATAISPTHVSLRSSENPAYVGDSINFIAQVTADSGGIPRTSVALRDGNTVLQVTSLSAQGVARFRPISNLSVGTHRLSASFTGYGTFASSISPVLNQVMRFRLIPLPPLRH